MTGDEKEGGKQLENEVEPDIGHLIDAYLHYSEEMRYRDSLMHNSYYFILIAAVLITGEIMSLDVEGALFRSYKVVLGIVFLGFAIAGVGVVMNTYNQKRNHAEDQRRVLEQELDSRFSERGIFQEHASNVSNSRRHDNPFAVQSAVLSEHEGYVEKVVKNYLTIERVAAIAVAVGGVVALFGIGLLITVTNIPNLL